MKRFDETVGPGEELQGGGTAGKGQDGNIDSQVAQGGLQHHPLVNMNKFTHYEAMRREVEPRAVARVTRTVRSYAIGVVSIKKDCKPKRHKDGRMLQSLEEEPMEGPALIWGDGVCSEYGKQKNAEAGRVYALAGFMRPAVKTASSTFDQRWQGVQGVNAIPVRQEALDECVRP
eukprot:6218349-Amphidinium_carterae.1